MSTVQMFVIAMALILVVAGLAMILSSAKQPQPARRDILWCAGWLLLALGTIPLTIMLAGYAMDMFEQARAPMMPIVPTSTPNLVNPAG